MRQKIDGGKTLLVDGPACITLYSGAMRAFGAPIGAREQIVVRMGKRIPLEAIEDSEVEILLGNRASYEIIDEDPIPPSWKEIAYKLLSFNGEVEAIILGGIDSGKSSLSTYLANMALTNGRKVALIDGDLGQSDIGPPGTLGLSIIKRPITDPFNLQPDHTIFIGITSPYSVIDRVISGLRELRDNAVNASLDFIIINTDGWIEGANAVNYKCQLIGSLRPNFIIVIHDDNSTGSLTNLINSLRGMEVDTLLAETPKGIKRRDREMRKIIRETLYKRYLKDAKIRSIPLNWIKIDGTLEIRGKLDQALKKRLSEILSGDKVAYCENLQNHVILVLKKGATLSDEERSKISAELNKPVRIIYEGDEKGLLASLEDGDGRFLGIGTIHCVDYERGALKIYTNVDGEFLRVRVGQIRLDEKGNEVEVVAINP